MKTCSVDACERPINAKGMCPAHYARAKRGDDLTKPIRPRLLTDDLAERLREYAPPGEPDECWEWTLALRKGYGVISTGNGKNRDAHIVAWELANNRTLPKGMVVRHTCDNPPCVNPAHLLMGTHADNVADKVARGRQLRGEKMNSAKLTADKVLEIRRLAEQGTYQYEIAARFGVSQSNVNMIVNRKTWAHVA